jgi:hypothetical protein
MLSSLRSEYLLINNSLLCVLRASAVSHHTEARRPLILNANERQLDLQLNFGYGIGKKTRAKRPCVGRRGRNDEGA